MTKDKLKKGYGNSKPLYGEDKKGRIIPIHIPADAISEGAKPGDKAGSSLIDDINKKARQEDLIKSSLTNEIIEIIKKVIQEVEYNISYIRKEINDIIKNKIKDQGRIELLLEDLLGLSSIGLGKKEFKKLNKYYISFDKENAEEYNKSYEKILIKSLL